MLYLKEGNCNVLELDYKCHYQVRLNMAKIDLFSVLNMISIFNKNKYLHDVFDDKMQLHN